jgi:hypothetical protein
VSGELAVKLRLGAAASVLVVLATTGGAADLEPTDGAAAEPKTLVEAIERGRLSLDLRYRLESVADDAFAKDALASTLRSALSFETAAWRGLFTGLVIENVSAIGNDELYNNAGAGDRGNGVTDRPVVADPEITEIDEVYLGFRGPRGLEIKAGRFAYTLDNQRFIGIAPWRQNHRSYEGASLALALPAGVDASYAFLDRAFYDTGASFGMSTHLLHLARELRFGTVAAYGYLVDWDDAGREGLSSATIGARIDGSSVGSAFDLIYLAEYARQSDYGDNLQAFGLDYIHAVLGARRGPWALRAGWELKDGDGVNAVQTLLGTNHGLNGFADKLAVTPPEGSHDRFLRLSFDRERWAWLLAYHDFEAAVGGAPQGTEIDFQGSYTPVSSLSFFLKVARYRAQTLSTDTTKVMAWTTWSFDLR